MTRPVRLHLSRRAGFRLQEHSLAVNGLPAVNVARPSRWGNPHVALPCLYHGPMPAIGRPAFKAGNADEMHAEGVAIAVALYRRDWEIAMLATYCEARAALEELRGRNLVCWCRPGSPCHADVLLELANPPRCEEVASP